MSPVTHFLTGWMLANSVSLDRRDRALVTLAAIVPDVDGLGIVADVLSRHSQHPTDWFSSYHHSLHTLLFAVIVSAASLLFSDQRWKTAALRTPELPRASARRFTGKPRPGRISVARPLPDAVLTRRRPCLERAVGTQCVAEFCHHHRVLAGEFLSCVVARIFSVGNGFREGGFRRGGDHSEQVSPCRQIRTW